MEKFFLKILKKIRRSLRNYSSNVDNDEIEIRCQSQSIASKNMVLQSQA